MKVCRDKSAKSAKSSQIKRPIYVYLPEIKPRHFPESPCNEEEPAIGNLTTAPKLEGRKVRSPRRNPAQTHIRDLFAEGEVEVGEVEEGRGGGGEGGIERRVRHRVAPTELETPQRREGGDEVPKGSLE